MKKLDKEKVKQIARLARLEVREEEGEKFSEQLTSILEYVETLNEVETDGVETTTQVTGRKNISREDKVNEKLDPAPKDLLACSPNPVELNQIKVKGVIES